MFQHVLGDAGPEGHAEGQAGPWQPGGGPDRTEGEEGDGGTGLGSSQGGGVLITKEFSSSEK